MPEKPPSRLGLAWPLGAMLFIVAAALISADLKLIPWPIAILLIALAILAFAFARIPYQQQPAAFVGVLLATSGLLFLLFYIAPRHPKLFEPFLVLLFGGLLLLGLYTIKEKPPSPPQPLNKETLADLLAQDLSAEPKPPAPPAPAAPESTLLDVRPILARGLVGIFLLVLLNSYFPTVAIWVLLVAILSIASYFLLKQSALLPRWRYRSRMLTLVAEALQAQHNYKTDDQIRAAMNDALAQELLARSAELHAQNQNKMGPYSSPADCARAIASYIARHNRNILTQGSRTLSQSQLADIVERYLNRHERSIRIAREYLQVKGRPTTEPASRQTGKST